MICTIFKTRLSDYLLLLFLKSKVLHVGRTYRAVRDSTVKGGVECFEARYSVQKRAFRLG
jgi:hypothetical protein